MSGRVFIVTLRQPRRKDDGRADPFWEFGSFGCTGCHSKNLLHPKNCSIADGDRLAFVQGGHLGSRLLLVTPPVRRAVLGSAGEKQCVELRWDAAAQPFRYDRAPPLFEAPGPGQLALLPRLAASITKTSRMTIDAKFASRFRARARPLADDLASEVVARFKKAAAQTTRGDLIHHYTEALPKIDPGAVIQDRKAAYRALRQKFGKAQRTCYCPKPASARP